MGAESSYYCHADKSERKKRSEWPRLFPQCAGVSTDTITPSFLSFPAKGASEKSDFL